MEAVRDALADPATSVFFTDEVRCPAVVDDVAAAVVALCGDRELIGVSGPLHLAGADAVSRFDFAQAIARWLGADGAALRPGTQADLGLVRPGRLILDSSACCLARAPLPWRRRPARAVSGVRRRSS